ncbi:DUF6198 family protein [Selenomonadales bacterium OttesenSCG-928-I06]|nr:DUF6198 family protein [Selenomonadales bacterium OttesenSCG-928-I06]
MDKNEIKKWLFVALGLFISGLGIALIAKANLGLTPIATLPFVISRVFTLSLGLGMMITSSLMVLTQIIILGKNFEKMQYLQFAMGFVLGLSVDISLYFLTLLNPENYFSQMTVLFLGCIILSFGISIQVIQNLILMPAEALVKVISEKLSKGFGPIKVYFDVFIVALAIGISIVFLDGLEGVREGTIILALVSGMFIRFFLRRFNYARA